MSRQATAAQRNLTLTEELEKLEQSITLTLQEIDHNFSRAHRIVTTSILPVVENYREHSTQVWEGSQFWKQFFEASANVSLSGYEEPPPEESEMEGEEEDEGMTTTTTTESAQATLSSASYASPPVAQNGEDEATMTPTNSQYSTTAAAAGDYSPSPTPKAHPVKMSKAPYSSPYESLRRATLGDSPSDSEGPSTPHVRRASPAKRNPQQPQSHQQSSPFAPPSTYRHAAHRTPSHNDVLLHRVLDKTWRIQATPHSTARLPHRGGAAESQHPSPAKASTARKPRHQQQQNHTVSNNSANNKFYDNDDPDDLDSSPAAPAPQLHAEIFDTPARKGIGAGAGAGTRAGDRVPGISVLTPAKGAGIGTGRKGLGGTPADKVARGARRNPWDSDDDDDDDDGEGGDGMGGMSPPKTIQFHVPQSRLVRTPGSKTAREASKRIVENLLLTAGMADGVEELEAEEEEGSPSIIKPSGGLLEEDTF